MDYGAIIKRAWHVTWRYKALWVLGIFAGVSGCTSSGGGNYNSGSSDFSSLGKDFGGGAGLPSATELQRMALGALPLIIAVSLLLLLLWLVWSIFSVAARGGLIAGVNTVETGGQVRLGELWGTGFSRFWTLVGLDILINLPLFFGVMVIVLLITVPLIGTMAAGGDPNPAAVLAPMCGVLVIGVPILVVAGVILGIMYVIAQRYVVLGGQGAFESARNSWRFLRLRVKDTLLMWLISGALNLAASFVLAIPAVFIGIAIGLPMVAAIVAESWGLVAALGVVLVLLVSALSILYTGIWGTYSSALWTIFFRDVAGMSAPQPAPVMAYAAEASPQPTYMPPPMPPSEPYAPAPPTPPEQPYPSAPPEPPAGA
jgi:hypothetical protein